jgi:hypothetical protein
VRPELGDAGELLEATATAAYQARLDDLRAELEEAEAFHDPVRADSARDERDFLVGGRPRWTAATAGRRRTLSAPSSMRPGRSARQWPTWPGPAFAGAACRHQPHRPVLFLRPDPAPRSAGLVTRRAVLGAPVNDGALRLNATPGDG